MLLKMFEKISLMCIFLSFSAVTYTPIWNASSAEFFGFLTVFFLFLSVDLKKIKVHVDEIFYIFVIFVILIILQNLFLGYYFKENVFLFLMYLIAFFICANVARLKDEKYFLQLVFVVLAVGVFSVFVIFSQYFDVNYDWMGVWMAGYDQAHGRPYANLGQPNLAATLLLTSLCCAIFLYLQQKIGMYTIFLIAFFFGVALSLPASKTSLLSLVILIGSAIFLGKKIIAAIFITALCAFFVPQLFSADVRVMGNDDISTGRLDMWWMMLKTIPERPWLGYGVLNTQIANFDNLVSVSRWNGQVIGSSHNIALDFFIWGGVFFGAVVTFFSVKILIGYVRKNIRCEEYIYLLVPMTTHALLEFPMYYSSFLFLFCIILNFGCKNERVLKGNSLIFFFFPVLIVMFLIVCLDYLSIAKKYTDLRFFENNFAGASIPDFNRPMVLDILGENLNILIDKENIALNEMERLEELTKITPSFHNFKRLIMIKNKINDRNSVVHWMGKAKYSLLENDYKMLEKYVSELNGG